MKYVIRFFLISQIVIPFLLITFISGQQLIQLVMKTLTLFHVIKFIRKHSQSVLKVNRIINWMINKEWYHIGTRRKKNNFPYHRQSNPNH